MPLNGHAAQSTRKGKSAITNLKKNLFCTEEEQFISLLPPYNSPETLLVSDTLPYLEKRMESKLTKQVLIELNRQFWAEGLYVNKKELGEVKRYKNGDGNYKNDFDAKQFLE